MAIPLAVWGIGAVGSALLVRQIAATAAPGSTRVFPINQQSVRRVQGVVAEMMHEGCTADEVHKVALLILQQQGLTEASPADAKARALHRFVADRIQYVDDPMGFERIESPQRMAYKVLSGQQVTGDCDDLALFLSAMYISVGLPASVAFLDTNNDGDIDHAMSTVLVNGQIQYAETTIQGVSFGWKPQTKNPPEVLPLYS